MMSISKPILLIFSLLLTVFAAACSSSPPPITSETGLGSPITPTAVSRGDLDDSPLMDKEMSDSRSSTALGEFMSHLSSAERACVIQDGNIQQITAVISDPLSISQEELATAITCLGEDSLTALYLSGIVPDLGLLTEEATACVYDGLQSEKFDMRGLMIGGVSGEDGMKYAAATSLVLIYCSGDADRAAMKYSLGIPPDEMQLMDCVVDSYDGPRDLVDTTSERLLASITKCEAVGIVGDTEMPSLPGR